MKYVIGNWKSNKLSDEVKLWWDGLKLQFELKKDLEMKNLTAVIAPPVIYLPYSRQLRDQYQLPIKLAAQNVSSFDQGAYTGEVTASQLHEYVEYVLIGHSERRNYCKEDDELLSQKVAQAIKNNLVPIYCVQNENTPVPRGVAIVAYEPPTAIGTGKPDTVENAAHVSDLIKQKTGVQTVIYGGSVKPENISSYFHSSSIDGVLPGGASLNPQTFWDLILHAIES